LIYYLLLAIDYCSRLYGYFNIIDYWLLIVNYQFLRFENYHVSCRLLQ